MIRDIRQMMTFDNILGDLLPHTIVHRLPTSPHHPAACDEGAAPTTEKALEPYDASSAVITQYQKAVSGNCNMSACSLNHGYEHVKKFPPSKIKTCSRLCDCVTVTVKTKHRLSQVVRFIKSLHKFYPGTRIIVADEYYTQYDYRKFPEDWLQLYKSTPKDLISYIRTRQGVGLGRKIATMLADTKYILVADDDFIVTENTNLMTLVKALDTTDLTVASGAVNDHYPFDGAFRAVENGDHVHLIFYPGVFYEHMGSELDCYVCDVTKNFFLAKRDAILEKGSWDEKRLYFEHEDFFLQMRKQRAKVAYCPNVVVTHITKDRSLARTRKMYYKKWTIHLKQKWQFHEYYYCKDPSLYLVSDLCPEKKQEVFG